MKTESSMNDQGQQKLGELPRENKTSQSKSKKKKKKTKTKTKKKMMNKKAAQNIVQCLFQTCKQVFPTGEPGFIPPPADLDRLCSVLDRMKAEDLNLTPNMSYFNATQSEDALPPVTYLHLYECQEFSIGIFCLPPSGIIPLHNHPGMTVFSKLLFGTMHIKSYDWVTDHTSRNSLGIGNRVINSERPELGLAKIHMDSDVSAPCNASILYPTAGGNMHCFRALSPCAILDVLGPPYSDLQGRHCAYYHDHPYCTFSATVPEEGHEGHAWLEEREKPEDFLVAGAMYDGPKIEEN